MSWKQKGIEILVEVLRYFARAAMAINLILISIFSVWFVARFLWHTMGWLNRTLFSSSW